MISSLHYMNNYFISDAFKDTVEYSINSLCHKCHDVVYCIKFSYSYSFDNVTLLMLNVSIGEVTLQLSEQHDLIVVNITL